MMNVSEYANDVQKKPEEILAMCQKLKINATKVEDELSEDDIIMLDSEIEHSEEESKEALEKKNPENKPSVKQKSKKNNQKQKESSKDGYEQRRKEMYKNKNKLKSNVDKDNDKIVIYEENMTLQEFAQSLKISAPDVIKKLMSLGKMLNINASIDYDTAEILALEYNKELSLKDRQDETNFENIDIIDDEKDLKERPPVVTIMGHVDHGKTTLLDTIRKTNVASNEAGGITQAIGTYQITYNDKKITFIDTPGHAAFTEMRARGASITDIIIIIVAADDGVMPQTIEVIDHAKAAKVPIIVAINKIDKPGANPEKVMTEMSSYDLMPEQWGGDVMYTNISALNKIGIEDLLERILLISELQSLKANPERYASGTVVESKMDKALGVVSTILIQNGTLRLGDNIVVGNYAGKVRTMKNDKGENLTEAPPSTPVWITGISTIPSAGDKFMAFENEKKAKTISEKRLLQANAKNTKQNTPVSLDDLFDRISNGNKEINVILKADVKGSEEAVKNSLLKLDVEGIKINVIRTSVGAITESDIVLASASDAFIIGFNVRPNSKILEYAKEKSVDIRLYNIIYKLLEDMEDALKGKLEPVFEEKVIGEAEVRKLFKFSKIGTIAGCYVTSGIIKRDSKVRLIRDGIVVYDGNINSIAREKDQVKEVKQGLECGITIEKYNDIKEKDILEAYEMVEIER